jgi:hypothetical protein
MTATLARSAAPVNALRVWCDDVAVYTEIPGKPPNGLPHVMSFPLHEGGLSKALNILRVQHRQVFGRTDSAGVPLDRVGPTAQPSNRPSIGTPIQRAHAQAVLRRLGITK